MTDKIIKFYPKHIQEAKSALEILRDLPDKDIVTIMAALSEQFIIEIEEGLKGELDYEDAPFFEQADKLFAEYNAPPSGCYFCDRTIDGNEKPFDFPGETQLCMSCMEKVANVMKAFGIDPRSLFPGIAERKHQKVLYEKFAAREKGEVVH